MNINVNINKCRGYKYITGKVYFTHLSIFMAVLKQCTTSTAETNKWRMTNELARPTPTTVQRNHNCFDITHKYTINQKAENRGANNEMNVEMRKNCLKGGVGLRYHWTILNLLFLSQFSISGYKWLQIWRFQPTTLQQIPTFFYSNSEETRKKKDFLLKKGRGGACCAAPIKQKGGR